MTSPHRLDRRTGERPIDLAAQPFSKAFAKQTLEAILAEINNPRNDLHHLDPSRPGQGAVAEARQLGGPEADKLIAALAKKHPNLARVVYQSALPDLLKPERKGGVFLNGPAARALNAAAEALGLDVRYEARKPVLQLATPMAPNHGGGRIGEDPIEGVVPLAQIGANAPVDAKILARINEISAKALAKEAGKGKNVLASVVNILDMIAPVAVSLLPARHDSAAVKADKSENLKRVKKDLGAAHLSDQAFIHQLQSIHAQLLGFKGLVTMGNELVVDNGNALRDGVGEAVQKAFGAELKSLPMKAKPEAAAKAMSDSIEAATTVYKGEGRDRKKVQDGLQDVVKPAFLRGLDAASIATLTALLDWKFVFDKERTQEAEVKNADGVASQRKLMELTTGHRLRPGTQDREQIPKLQVAETDGMVFVKVPYDDGKQDGRNAAPTRVYRIIGAPLVDRAQREKVLARMIGRLDQNDPLTLEYAAKNGRLVMPRIKSEAEADPFTLLANAGVDAKSWEFPLLEGASVKFGKGIHKGAIEDTEVGSVVKFVSVGGMLRGAMPRPEERFDLRADVPHYNAIVVELEGPGGQRLPLKVAEWTIEDFKAAKEPTADR